MKIDEIDFIPIAIDRNEVFRISTGSSLTAENVLVRVKAEGRTGWGNASPSSVTEETTESILNALKTIKEEMEGRDIKIEETWRSLRKKIPKDRAALAGFDIALQDLKGNLEGKRVFELYDGREEGVPTDRTIGLMTTGEAEEHAQRFIEEGFKAIKIKIGLGVVEDIKRIQAVRNIVGEDIDLWVDANQAFSPEEAITVCKKIEPFDIEFVEQPVHVDDLEGLKKVTKESDIPIMADETMKDYHMAEKICEEDIADMVNIKLMKCSGITGARKIIDVLEENDKTAMVGCMGETTPSIAAGVHTWLTSDNIKYADLDSTFMLSDNIAEGLEFKKGELWTKKEKGLGIDVLEEKVEEYRMDIEATS